MEGKAKVTVEVDGKETKVLEGDFVFCVVAKAEDNRSVVTEGMVHASATAEVIGRAIAEMEEKLDEVKRENPAIALKAIEWKLQLSDERCDELLKECDKILGGDDNE